RDRRMTNSRRSISTTRLLAARLLLHASVARMRSERGRSNPTSPTHGSFRDSVTRRVNRMAPKITLSAGFSGDRRPKGDHAGCQQNSSEPDAALSLRRGLNFARRADLIEYRRLG